MSEIVDGSDEVPSLGSLLSAWCDAADRRDAKTLCGFFAEPGSHLVMGGVTHHGLTAISACLESRLSETRQTRHLWSNLHTTALESGRVLCVSTQLTIEHEEGQAQARLRVSDVRDVVRHDVADGWRFESRSVTRVMSFLGTAEK